MEKWAHSNLLKFSKDKCKVWHLGKHNPGVHHRLGSTRLGSRSVDGTLRVLVDTKLIENDQCAPVAQEDAGLHWQRHCQQR